MRWRIVLAVGAVGLLAVGARSLAPERVFTEDGLRLRGNDAYYHLLRVQRTLEDGRVPVRDPWLSYPDGALIPWPPLFDGAVAGIARVFGGGPQNPSRVESVAAWTPVVIGLLSVLALAAAGALILGPWEGVLAALFLALLPGHVLFTRLGRLDQHGVEAMIMTGMAGAFVWIGRRRGAGKPARAGEVLLAALMGLAFLTWQGSVLHLAVLMGALALLWIVHPEEGAAREVSRSVAGAALGAAGILAVGIVVTDHPSSLLTVSLAGLNGFHVAAVLMAAAFGWALPAAPGPGDWGGPGRFAQAALTAGVVLVAGLLLVPGLGAALLHGIEALGASSAWYGNIREFDPLLMAGFDPLSVEASRALRWTGLALPVAPVAAVVLARRGGRFFVPSRTGGRPARAFLLFWGLSFLALALMRQRFLIYATAPLALWLAALAVEAARALARRTRRGWMPPTAAASFAAVVLVPCVSWYAGQLGSGGEDPDRQALMEALAWLRHRPAPLPDRPAVFAEWDYGHLVQYEAGKPVLVSPFGTDLGEAAMRDFADAFTTDDPERLEAILERRSVGFLILTEPVTEAVFSQDFAPAGTPELVQLTLDWRAGASVRVLDPFWATAAARLYYRDGMVPAGFEGEALGRYRLVWESTAAVGTSAGTAAQARDLPAFKVFERVPGAVLRLEGLPPGSRASALVELTTADRASRSWRTTVLADWEGVAVLRVPYATGRNGSLLAGAYTVAAGGGVLRVAVGEGEVLGGEALLVRPTPPVRESGGP